MYKNLNTCYTSFFFFFIKKRYSIELDNVDLFLETATTIGEIFFMFGDNITAVKLLDAVRVVCNTERNYKCKLRVLKILGEISKKECFYKHAISFFKKAI